jgi:hypothetical protein
VLSKYLYDYYLQFTSHNWDNSVLFQ